MSRRKEFGMYLAVFAGLLALLWLMLVFAAVIPNAALYRNMEQSALSYREKEAFSFENGGRWNAISDNYGEVILLNVSWNMGEGNPLVSSLDTKYYDGEAFGESIGLYLAVTDENTVPNADYTRYWHGTAVFVRLMHLVTDVNGMKLFGMAAAFLFLLITAVLLMKRRHYALTGVLLLAVASVQIWNIRLSMEYQPAFIICFLLCPMYLWLEKRADVWLVCLSVAGGVLIAFFDFLTTETVTLLLPLILVVTVRAEENRLGSLRDNVRLMVKCGIAWLLAYAGTFFIKWTAVSAVTGENKYRIAISSAGERIGGSLQGEGSDQFLVRVPEAVAANLSALFGGESRVDMMRIFAGLAISVLVLGSLFYLFHKKQNGTAAVLLALLGGVVIVRYAVLNNHSYLHSFFTYRALVSPIMALLAGMSLSMQFPTVLRRGRRSGPSHLRTFSDGFRHLRYILSADKN